MWRSTQDSNLQASQPAVFKAAPSPFGCTAWVSSCFNELRIFGRQVAYHHFCIGVNYLVTVRRLTSNIVDGLPWRDMQDLNLHTNFRYSRFSKPLPYLLGLLLHKLTLGKDLHLTQSQSYRPRLYSRCTLRPFYSILLCVYLFHHQSYWRDMQDLNLRHLA